jgi:pimeloyl-ACP methyl ester carboxylesterase
MIVHHSRNRWVSSLVVAALAAVTLSGCGSGNPAPSPSTLVAVADAPVQVAQTSRGNVAYRITGSGPNLVLIMGYSGTMETWDPHFVDTLARHFRVVIFDNTGTGKTAALHSPLTIDAMANQTSALMTALHLGSSNVLGWSMGGMIAQALAVLHPAQVRRLVLCATFPGNGTTVKPSQKNIDALTSQNSATPTVLFPADQVLAADAFLGSVAAYPVSAPVRASTVAAQGGASLAWFNGQDVAGRQTPRISVPTLVADGANDHLDALANDHGLSALIPHSRLVLYPDAGHGFLFQEGAEFTFLVRTFLVGTPTPLSVTQMRQRYLAGFRTELSAGSQWETAAKALTSKSTARDLARIDVSLADVAGAFDDELLSFGATGSLGAALSASVSANERNVNDLLALGALSGATAKNYKATSAHDGAVGLALSNALRRRLNLPPYTPPATTTTTRSLNNL